MAPSPQPEAKRRPRVKALTPSEFVKEYFFTLLRVKGPALASETNIMAAKATIKQAYAGYLELLEEVAEGFDG